jgi:hypothetical protein
MKNEGLSTSMASRRQFRQEHDSEPGDEVVEALRYLAHQIAEQRTELTGRLDKLDARLEKLADEFQEFRLVMTRDFTQLNTQVQTGVKMG